MLPPVQEETFQVGWGPRKLIVCLGPKPGMFLVLSQLCPGQRPEMFRRTGLCSGFLFSSCFSFYIMNKEVRKSGVSSHLIDL